MGKLLKVAGGLNGFNQKLTMSKFHIQEYNIIVFSWYLNGLQSTLLYFKVLTSNFKYFKHLKYIA